MSNLLILNNKKQIPTVGLGTWRSEKGKVGEAIEYAIIESGYRHIDCASVYGNEKEIGAAFKKVFASGKVKREEVFITSKLWNTEHHPLNVEVACRKTLNDLRLDYLDLYLVHWGIAFAHGGDLEPIDENGMVRTENVPMIDTWREMEKLVEKGLTRSIGVANFTVSMLVDLLSYAKVKPVVNQVEVHPYNSQDALISYCGKKDIVVTAYSPLGSQEGDKSQRPVNDKKILEIADAHKKTSAQILIRWLVQRGISAIPKSIFPERIAGNIDVYDFSLTDSDMNEISKLNRDYRFVDPVAWWGLPYFK